MSPTNPQASPEENLNDALQVERGPNGVVTLTLNRPHVKNAISGPMWEPLEQIFREVRETESDRVLVITGAGGAFCAGAEVARTPWKASRLSWKRGRPISRGADQGALIKGR